MGIWTTVRQALGLDPPPKLRAPDAPEVSARAEARLAALPAGHGATVSLLPAPAGVVVRVVEGPLTAPPHPGFAGLRIACSDEDHQRLRGLTLDHAGDHWRVQAHVAVSARETPNPDGRLYLVDRTLADGRQFFGPGTTDAPWLIQQLLDRPDVRSVLLRDHTLTVERVPGQPWDRLDRAVGTTIREHVLAAGGVITRPPRPLHDDTLERAVWEVIEQRLLPGIHRDGGDVELLEIEDGVVRVRLVGACRTCPASTLTLKGGIERVLREAFPDEIDTVESVQL